MKKCVLLFFQNKIIRLPLFMELPNLTDILSAKEIVSVISEAIGGKGGGRPDFAQGAGESKY